MWFTEYLFLERNWAKDEGTLKALLEISVSATHLWLYTVFLHLIYDSISYIWAFDSYIMQSGLQRLQDFPKPFWLALFVEGTRFTQAKLLAAQEYAASQGLPIPRNVLIPRTKVNFQF